MPMMAGHAVVALPSSKIKENIARILQEEGYISGYEVSGWQEWPARKFCAST